MEYEVEALGPRKLIRSIFTRRSVGEVPFPIPWIDTVTARSAMALILSHMGNKGILTSRNTEVLVPQWLCIALLQLMGKYCVPTTDPSRPVRAVVIYHQYGFPQNMDEVLDYCDRKKIEIIEDCANLFEGTYRGKRLGTFGYASVFSFGKIFPSVWGAGLATSRKELYDYALESQSKLHSSLISNALHFSKYIEDRRKEHPSPFFQTMTSMLYGVIEHAQKMHPVSKKIILAELQAHSLERRLANYKFLLTRFKSTSYFAGLESEGVYPFVVPLFSSEDRLRKLVTQLTSRGFNSGVYHFDINRNVFNPKYVKCAWIPVHQGLTLTQMEEIAQVIEELEP